MQFFDFLVLIVGPFSRFFGVGNARTGLELSNAGAGAGGAALAGAEGSLGLTLVESLALLASLYPWYNQARNTSHFKQLLLDTWLLY